MKKQVLALAVLAALGSVAHAEDGLTANLTLTSKYKYRGQDQADTKEVLPALQGGFDYTLGGLYVGNWNSSIGFTSAGLEMDVYGGYKGEVMPGLGYDVGVLTYYYPGSGASVFNTTEVYGGLSYSVASLKYSLTVSDKYFGITDGRNTGYLDLAANFDLMAGLVLNTHLGYTLFSSGAKDAGAVNYYDYKIGVTKDLGKGFSAAAAFVDANKDATYGDVNKRRVVLSITKTL